MSRADEATKADWSFLFRPEVCEGIHNVARVSAEASGMDGKDLAQDLSLWLAVRPEVQKKEDHLVVLDLKMAARTLRRINTRRNELVTTLPFEEDHAE